MCHFAFLPGIHENAFLFAQAYSYRTEGLHIHSFYKTCKANLIVCSLRFPSSHWIALNFVPAFLIFPNKVHTLNPSHFHTIFQSPAFISLPCKGMAHHSWIRASHLLLWDQVLGLIFLLHSHYRLAVRVHHSKGGGLKFLLQDLREDMHKATIPQRSSRPVFCVRP